MKCAAVATAATKSRLPGAMSRFVRRFVSISRGTRRSSRTVAGPGRTVLADSDLDLAIAREPYLPACPEPIE
jgi:hypothetical protein